MSFNNDNILFDYKNPNTKLSTVVSSTFLPQEGMDINYSSKSERNSIDSITSPVIKKSSDDENEKIKQGMVTLILKVRNNGNEEIEKLKLLKMPSMQILGLLNDAFDKQMIDFGIQINQIIKQFSKSKQDHDLSQEQPTSENPVCKENTLEELQKCQIDLKNSMLENDRLSKQVSELPSREESAQLLKEFKAKLFECDQKQKTIDK